MSAAPSPSTVAFAAARLPPRSAGPASRRPSRLAFTGEEILAAVRRWAMRYGEPPTMLDWDPARARRTGHAWRADRFDEDQWPTVRMVCRQFGGFNPAIAAAGFAARRAPARQRANLTGSGAITEAIIEWTRRYGDVPTMADWDPARARRLKQDWRIARYYQGDWPSARSVALHFGSFAEAAAAAGLVGRQRGVHHAHRRSEQGHNREVVARARSIGRTPGIEDLSIALRALARARIRHDPIEMHSALVDLAGAALAWASVFGDE